MKICYFCGSQGGSEEHVISDSVRTRMQMTEVEIESGVREAEGYSDFRRPHRFERLVTREVCDTCNRGWMSQLEIKFLTVAGALIEPNWAAPDIGFLREAMRRSEVIGRWALKTAITASLAGVLDERIHRDIAVDLRLGKLPERFVLKLGYIRQRSFNLLINPGFKFLDTGREEWRVSESGRAFDAVLQLNHLTMRAINAPGIQLGFESQDSLLPLCAFPTVETYPLIDYSFESFEDFEQRLFARHPTDPTKPP